MSFRTLVAAACVTIGASTASFASTLAFDFYFSNDHDTVSGTVFGLDADGVDQQATEVRINGALDTYVFTHNVAKANSFSVSNGSIVDFDFIAFPAFGRDNGQLRASVQIMSGAAQLDEFISGSPSESAETFGNVAFASGVPAAVPLPAGVMLLLTGVGGLAALKRRKKRAASV